jgi:hypothetical protein
VADEQQGLVDDFIEIERPPFRRGRAVMPRIRCTISLARRALCAIRVVSWPTFARLGSSRESQRRLVSALVTMAESG